MKTLLLLILISLSLYSYEFDKLLLRAQASLFPKIILLDQEINLKTIDNTVLISIIYNNDEAKEAKNFKNNIYKQYKKRLGNYNLVIKTVHVDEFSDTDNSSAYFIFNTLGKNKKNIITHAIKNQRICFSYSNKSFANDTLISLFLKEKTYIYLNKSALSKYKIKFTPIFYKIAKAI